MKNISMVKGMGDPQYTRDVLEARRDFLRLRLEHEEMIAEVYDRAAEDVASRARELGERTGELTRRHLNELEKNLHAQARRVREVQENLMQEGTGKAMQYAGKPSQNHLIRALRESGADDVMDVARIQFGFSQVNTAAVEAFWARTHEGLRVSERIWDISDRNVHDRMRDLLEVGIATGRDAVEVARDLEQYVKDGRRTLSGDYHRMMDRMDKRVPKNLNYEALRLVRTEYTKAFNEAVISRGRTNPAYQGVRWQLSAAHPEIDVCDDYAEADLHGMGEGVYKKGHEPTNPHPNCLCHLVPVMMDKEEFIGDLQAWQEDPDSVPYMEEWYNEYYKPHIARGVPYGMPEDLKFPGDFETAQQAEDWANQKYPNIEFDFHGSDSPSTGFALDPEAVNRTLEEFVELADQYPEVAQRLEYVGTYRGPNAPRKYIFDRGEWAHASRDGKRIGLSPTVYKDAEKYKTQLRHSSVTGWHPSGCDTIGSVMRHEYGHQVHNWLEQEGQNQTLTRLTDETYFCQVAGHLHGFEQKRNWSPKLGDYSHSSSESDRNRREMFAEGFAAQRYGTEDVKRSTYVKTQGRLLELTGPDSRDWVPVNDVLWPSDQSAAQREQQRDYREKVERLLQL